MTTEANHTEGPWEVDGFAVVGGDGNTVCMMGEIDGFERGYTPCKNDGPNGKLIAAAPDLLAAVEEVARASNFGGDTVSFLVEINRISKVCVAALAKARGA